jgi:hypothetical protein
MPCLLGCLALMVPRLLLVGLFLFTRYLDVFQTRLWPLLGFIFMPLTTLAYAYAKHASGSVDGWYLALVIIAAMIDLGSWGHGGWRGRAYRVTRVD